MFVGHPPGQPSHFYRTLSNSELVLSAELHAHSSLSHDGRDPVDLILEQAAGVGLDAIAVTDHDQIEASLEAVELAPEYGLIAIPATEVSTADGHVLAFGVEEVLEPRQSFLETVTAIHDRGGIAVVPHPFQASRSGVLTKIDPSVVIEHADAIEVYNSRLLTGRANRKAERFARRYDLPMTAGSDAHVCEMIGQAVTHIDAEDESVEAILEAIADGRTEIDGRRTPWRISFRQAAGGVKRRIGRRLPW